MEIIVYSVCSLIWWRIYVYYFRTDGPVLITFTSIILLLFSFYQNDVHKQLNFAEESTIYIAIICFFICCWIQVPKYSERTISASLCLFDLYPDYLFFYWNLHYVALYPKNHNVLHASCKNLVALLTFWCFWEKLISPKNCYNYTMRACHINVTS